MNTTAIIESALPVDIIQNKASQSLVSGSKMSTIDRLWSFCVKGGLTMIPLGAIVLWALFLVITRLFYFAFAHNNDYRLVNNALKLLENNRTDLTQMHLFRVSIIGIFSGRYC